MDYEKTKVWIETNEQFHAVLDKLYNKGYYWFTKDKKPAKQYILNDGKPFGIYIKHEGESGLGWDREKDWNTSNYRQITVDDILYTDIDRILNKLNELEKKLTH